VLHVNFSLPIGATDKVLSITGAANIPVIPNVPVILVVLAYKSFQLQTIPACQ
jgi:hypothetical protein